MDTFNDTGAQETIRRHLLESEGGPFRYPYLDSNGIITTGVGLNINRKQDFHALPWKVPDGNGGMRRASQSEIREAFEQVRQEFGLRKGRFEDKAEVYEDATQIRLDVADVIARFNQESRERTADVRKTLGEHAW